MKEYMRTTVTLSLYGIFKEFRPGEPYLVPYLTGPPLNFTTEQVSQEIFPVSAYAAAVMLIIVFLVTDYLRYKIIIIFQALSAVTTYLLYIYSRSVFQLQIQQAIHGFYHAGQVAYFTYIYAKVEKEYFQEVTGYTRSVYLVGKSLSGAAAQVCVYYSLTSYTGLMWISLASEVLATGCAICLPSVDESIYFHRKNIKRKEAETNNIEETEVEKQLNITEDEIYHTKDSHLKTVAGMLWYDFKTAYTNLYVLKWSVWWTLGSCGFWCVTYYIQVLWTTIRTEAHTNSMELNGLVETVYTILGALGSMMIGKIKLDWKRLGEPMLAMFSLLMAALVAVSSTTDSIYIAYVMFILFGIIYQMMITVANSEVAKHINRDSYALVFGINNFAVLVVMSTITHLVLQVFRLDARHQFWINSIYFVALGFLFLISMFTRRCIQ